MKSIVAFWLFLLGVGVMLLAIGGSIALGIRHWPYFALFLPATFLSACVFWVGDRLMDWSLK